MKTLIRKLLTGGAAASALALVLVSGPLTAQAGTAAIASHIDPGASYQCNAAVGVATGFNQVTYAVDATATVPGAQETTGVTCVVKSSTGTVYTTISGAEPGPQAAAEGLVTIPTNVTVVVCTYADTLTFGNV